MYCQQRWQSVGHGVIVFLINARLGDVVVEDVDVESGLGQPARAAVEVSVIDRQQFVAFLFVGALAGVFVNKVRDTFA